MTDQKQECCLEYELHHDIRHISHQLPDDDTLITLSEFFKVLSDMTRVKILSALLDNELCVCELAELIHMGQSAVSHQLRILRSAKIVKYRREGKSVLYSLDDEHIREVFSVALTHLKEGERAE